MDKNLYFTVLICTLNRHDKLIDCLRSIKRNTYKPYEVVIVDQSDELSEDLNQWIRKNKKIQTIRLYQIAKKNLSYAWNVGIRKARGNIIVFTDDDCIVDKHWLSQAFLTFKNKSISAVFGKTLPYKKSKPPIKDISCLCTFIKRKELTISSPCYHSDWIGYGNNMAIRKSIFNKIGLFKEWLGQGSIGVHGNDAEMIYRILYNGLSIRYNPKMVVKHNRWLTVEAHRRQNLFYDCGEMAAYGYYALVGERVARDVIIKNIKQYIQNFYYVSKHDLLRFKLLDYLKFLYLIPWEIMYRLWGLVVALIFKLLEELYIVKKIYL